MGTMTASPLEIAEATASDVNLISAFLWEAWRQAGPGAPGFSGATEEVIAEIADPRVIRDRLGGPERRMYIARQGERVVGFASTRTQTATIIELSGVVVLQEIIGSGIGTKLIDAAVDASVRNGFTAMTVSTEIDNNRARCFYGRHGFQVTGKGVEMVGPTQVKIVNMRRDL
jgi:ribosomal protein S18 acetylase RimI-like enzyme